MVAYSFKRRFVAPIQVGLGLSNHVHTFEPLPRPKLQTIRANRDRHARPGETMHLYYGMRTKECFLIGLSRCTSIDRIRIRFACPGRPVSQIKLGIGQNGPLGPVVRSLDDFARVDGFENWQDMRKFWDDEHDVFDFEGVIIKWEPIA